MYRRFVCLNFIIAVVFLANLSLAEVAVNPAAPVVPELVVNNHPDAMRILCFGDSITQGSGGGSQGGFRGPLKKLLNRAGIQTDFVGSAGIGQASPELPDPEHEGKGGRRMATTSKEQVESIFKAQKDLDIVIILIGINDMIENRNTVDTTLYLMSDLLDQVSRYAPKVRLLVGTLIPDAADNPMAGYDPDKAYSYVNSQAKVFEFNHRLPSLIEAKQAAGIDVKVVDLHNRLNYSDLSDGIHPNKKGYDKIAMAWFEAIKPIKALIVTGQSSHDWVKSTPIIKQILEQTGRFTVDVAVSPGEEKDMSSFRPDFEAYDVLVLNYVGDDWPEVTKQEFVDYVHNGGGVVAFHSANNSFPNWMEYNRITGIGGWKGRNEKWGPYVRWRDGKAVRDYTPGEGGSHPDKHICQVITRNKQHPIMKGIPEKWLHARDGLNIEMRGPAEELTVLATVYADPSISGGTDEHEPVMFTVGYGKGRVFHTMLGHLKNVPASAIECVGFITTFQRGTEWAATGKVTIPVPADFPTATEVRRWRGYRPPVDPPPGVKAVEFEKISSAIKESNANVRIKVVLKPASQKTVTVKYDVGGTTDGGEDHKFEQGTLTFVPGETMKILTVPIIDDAKHEPAETITIELKEPTGAIIGARPLHVLTITDNDPLK